MKQILPQNLLKEPALPESWFQPLGLQNGERIVMTPVENQSIMFAGHLS